MNKKWIVIIGFLVMILLAIIIYYTMNKKPEYSSNVRNVIVKGQVLDKDTQIPIEGAKIFIDHSYFIGADSDENDIYISDTINSDEKGMFQIKLDTVSSLIIQGVEKENYKNIKQIIKLPQQDKTDDIIINIEHYK